jgi:hypothetical protein
VDRGSIIAWKLVISSFVIRFHYGSDSAKAKSYGSYGSGSGSSPQHWNKDGCASRKRAVTSQCSMFMPGKWQALDGTSVLEGFFSAPDLDPILKGVSDLDLNPV